MRQPGRNDPCPCGSGRKFKHCCLAGTPPRVAAPALVVPRAPPAGYAPPPTVAAAAQEAYNRGTVLQAQGQLPAALEHYRHALDLEADFFEALVNRGNVELDLGQLDAAIASFRRALALRPDIAILHLNIGAAFQAQGRHADAIASYQSALGAGGPQDLARDPRIHNNLAIALREAGRLDEAVARFRTALELAPRAADVMHGLGATLKACGRPDEGAAQLRAALRLEPENPQFLLSLAGALLAAGRVEEALPRYRRALAGQPRNVDAWSGLLLCLLYSDRAEPAATWAEHRRYGAMLAAQVAAQAPATAAREGPCGRPSLGRRRLKIGYVSADLRAHSVAYFLEPVLAHHDHARFEIHCYSDVARPDAVTRRLRGLTDHWHDCTGIGHDALAGNIARDGIDVLIDLSGHTGGNRLPVFARRPAPRQLSWIGYPLGSGLAQIDFRLSDPAASPPARAQGDGERLWRLPRVFSCYRPPAGAPTPARSGGSGPAGITVGSFNNCAKLSESTVALWARLLQARPDMQLLLKDAAYGDPGVCRWMSERFAVHGVGAERLRLLPRQAADADHLALYGAIDIALDTYPYNGVTTTCEALWMGVPVVSLVGSGFAARMGLTLLSAVGQSQWAAASEDAYLAQVVRLADDGAARADLRTALRGQMQRSPLMDEAGFTAELEAAYQAIWAGEAPPGD